MGRYYADLNPRYGAKYERRWAVFIRRGPGDAAQTMLHYIDRRSAERVAAKLNKQERDEQADRMADSKREV
jgi:hypothetical protein